MNSDSPVSVLIVCSNSIGTIPYTLGSLSNQTLQPRQVYVAGKRPTDKTLEIINNWRRKLPIVIPGDSQARDPQQHRAPERSEVPYFAHLDDRCYWEPNYLETLVATLQETDSLVAIGGKTTVAPETNTFQKDVGTVMTYSPGTEAHLSGVLRSPVYRASILREIDEHRQLGDPRESSKFLVKVLEKHGELRVSDGTHLNIFPAETTTGFIQTYFEEGQYRGDLGSRDRFLLDRDRTIDRTLKLWTFGLCWNPLGWGLVVFYFITDLIVTFEQLRQQKSTVRFFYLLPLAHFSFWLGWLTTRFRQRDGKHQTDK